MAQDTELRRHKRGGIYFDDFPVGHLYEHPLTRTVTQMDNMLFSNMMPVSYTHLTLPTNREV